MNNKLNHYLTTLKESTVRAYYRNGKYYLVGELIEIGIDYIVLKCFSNDVIYNRIIPLINIAWIDKDIYNKEDKEDIIQELNSKLTK